MDIVQAYCLPVILDLVKAFLTWSWHFHAAGILSRRIDDHVARTLPSLHMDDVYRYAAVHLCAERLASFLDFIEMDMSRSLCINPANTIV